MSTVREVFDRYLVHAEAVGLWCAESLYQRRQRLAEFCALHGNCLVCDCKPYMLTDWIEGHTSWKSTATRKAAANQINSAMNWAVSQGRIGRNPFAVVSYPEAEPRPCMEDGTLDEVLLRANPRYARAVRFLRLTGCRLSDLCRMLWSDVDLERGMVTLAQHKSRKKTGKPKVFALVPAAVELLRDVRRESMAPADANRGLASTVIAVGTGQTDQSFVFLNNRSHPWTRRTLGQQLRRMKERHHIQSPASLHGIRHQLGTQAIKSGAPLKLVSMQLGHASTAITERYYCAPTANDVELMRSAAALGQVKKG